MSISHTYHGQLSIRLNKWMAELGLCSRREAEALIAQGGVRVDDILVEQPGHKIEGGQTLTLTAEAEQAIASKFTAILNKPVGYVSAQPEDDHIPAVRLLYQNRSADGTAKPKGDARLAPLGRLDMDSRGLLLLSEDGVLAKAIIGPQHSLEKEYIVKVSGKITTGRLTLLRNGLSLDERRLKPAKVTQIDDKTLRFILKEGRKRQIRRMCVLVGLHVTDLLRIRIGPLKLDDLSEGSWRLLTDAERSALIKAALPPKTGRTVPRESRPRAPAKARRAPRKPSPEKAALTRGKPGVKRSDSSAPRSEKPDSERPYRENSRQGPPMKPRSDTSRGDRGPERGPRKSAHSGSDTHRSKSPQKGAKRPGSDRRPSDQNANRRTGARPMRPKSKPPRDT